MRNVVPRIDKDYGICHHYINCRVDLSKNGNRCLRYLVAVCAKELNLYSGDAIYPIASGDLNQEPEEIFYAKSNLWDKRTKYGKNRVAVCELYIEKFNTLVDEYPKVKDVNIDTIINSYPNNHAIKQLLALIIERLTYLKMEAHVANHFKMILKEIHKHGRI